MLGSIMAGVIGGAMQGGAEQGIKEVEFQQNADLQAARDARLNEWKEKHDSNMLDRQSKIEDKRTDRAYEIEGRRDTRAEAAQLAAEARQRADLDSRETRAAGRDKSILDREGARQDAMTERAERDAERKHERDLEVARHNRISENTKLMTQIANTSGTKDPEYLRLQQENRILNNPPKVGLNLPPKPGSAGSETSTIKGGVGDISKVAYPSSEDLMIEIGKVQDEIGSGKLKPEDVAARKTYLSELKAKVGDATARETGPPSSAAGAAPSVPSPMQRANPYMNESNYTIDDLNRLAMSRPTDPMLQAALKARGRLTPISHDEAMPIMQGAGIL
jgi:hypothetical protein